MPAPASPPPLPSKKKIPRSSPSGKKKSSSGGPPKEVFVRVSSSSLHDDGAKKKKHSLPSTDDDALLQELLNEDSIMGNEESDGVSSLEGSAKEAMLVKKRQQQQQQQQQKQRHEGLDKLLLLSDGEGDDENLKNNNATTTTTTKPPQQPGTNNKKKNKSSESPGLIAARERYKSRSSSTTHNNKPNTTTSAPMIARSFSNNSQNRFNGAEENHSQEMLIVQGPTGMEEVSLGDQPSMSDDDDDDENGLVEVIDIEALMETRKKKNKNHKRHATNKEAVSDETSRTASGTDESGPYVINVVEPSSPNSKSVNKNKPRQQQPSKPIKSRTKQESPTQKKRNRRIVRDTNPFDDKEDSSSVSSSESESEEEEDDNESTGTKDLLEKAHERVTIQAMKSEMEQMQEVIAKKNEELEILAGQLRRAVETKCDLVLAHTEMERHHEHDLQQKETQAQQLLKANYGLMEGCADTERDLLNEIVRLKVELEDARKQHVQELQDWERMHQNEMLERDCELARLKEEQRKLLALQKSGSLSCNQPQQPVVQTVHKYHGFVG